MVTVRKLVAVALSLLVLAPAAPVPARPHAHSHEDAAAMWLFPTSRKHTYVWYFGFASLHETIDARRRQFAAIGRGTCVKARRGPNAMTVCEADRFVRGNARRDFTMGPLAARASLTIRKKGRRHAIHWSAPITEGSPYDNTHTCDGGGGTGAGIIRTTAVGGKLFGRHIPRDLVVDAERRYAVGVLQRGFVASTCGGVRSFEVEDGTVRATLNF